MTVYRFALPIALMMSMGAMLLFPGEAGAYREHTMTIANQPDAPLRIVEAASTYEDTRISSNFYWRVRAKVRNVSPNRVVAYELLWVLFDAFDGRLDEVRAVSNDAVNPGSEDAGAWERAALRSVGVKATVSVFRVRFEDGSIWTAEPVSQAAAVCGEAMKGERQRLLQLYRDRGLDTLLAELAK